MIMIKSKKLSMFGRRSNKCGFSLVEVTFALGILSFAFVSMFALVSASLNFARDSIDRTLSSQITQQMVSNIQETPFANINTLYGQLFYFDNNGQAQSSATGAIYVATIAAVTTPVQTSNNTTVGISLNSTQMVLIIITKHQQPLYQLPIAVSDVKL